jgi:hypothetical protein
VCELQLDLVGGLVVLDRLGKVRPPALEDGDEGEGKVGELGTGGARRRRTRIAA